MKELETVRRTLGGAERRVVRERRQVADERAALREFTERVREIGPATSAVSGAAPAHASARAMEVTGATGTRTAGAGGLAVVREAYRETVMSVPHYAEVYDDTYERSVVEEFGADVGAALTEGPAFTDQCKRGVLAAARSAREDREQFLAVIESEHDSLEAAAELLVPAASQLQEFDEMVPEAEPPVALDAYRSRLVVLKDRCEEVVETRQETVDEHRQVFRHGRTIPDLTVYLYGDLPATYPVLSVALDVVRRASDLRRDLRLAMEALR